MVFFVCFSTIIGCNNALLVYVAVLTLFDMSSMYMCIPSGITRILM